MANTALSSYSLLKDRAMLKGTIQVDSEASQCPGCYKLLFLF